MKFLAIFALVAVATVVSAETGSTVTDSPIFGNGPRLARGLPPNPPNKFKRGPSVVRRSSPSAVPGDTCKVGQSLCCASEGFVGYDDNVDSVLGELGIYNVPSGILVGLDCSPFGDHCDHFNLCCSDNSYNGYVSIGCSFRVNK